MENHHPIRSLADIENVSAPAFEAWTDELFPGFERFERPGTDGVTIRGVKGGKGTGDRRARTGRRSGARQAGEGGGAGERK